MRENWNGRTQEIHKDMIMYIMDCYTYRRQDREHFMDMRDISKELEESLWWELVHLVAKKFNIKGD